MPVCGACMLGTAGPWWGWGPSRGVGPAKHIQHRCVGKDSLLVQEYVLTSVIFHLQPNWRQQISQPWCPAQLGQSREG